MYIFHKQNKKSLTNMGGAESYKEKESDSRNKSNSTLKGWVGGWINEWVDMGGWVGGWMCGWMNGGMDGWMDTRCMGAWMHGCMDELIKLSLSPWCPKVFSRAQILRASMENSQSRTLL